LIATKYLVFRGQDTRTRAACAGFDGVICHELDVRISPVLAGKTKPKEALDDIYQAWEQITDRYGRESQKKLYAESYGAS